MPFSCFLVLGEHLSGDGHTTRKLKLRLQSILKLVGTLIDYIVHWIRKSEEHQLGEELYNL